MGSVGVPGGIEAIQHLVRRLNALADQDFIMLKVDFMNAFNRILRAKLVQCVLRFPALCRYTFAAYGEHSTLAFGDHLLLSASGVQQGDPSNNNNNNNAW